MFHARLARGASAGALTLVLFTVAAEAQETLPSIEVGRARRVTHSSHSPAPRHIASGYSEPADLSDPVPSEGAGVNGVGISERGSPKDPTAYKVWNTSSATKTNTPIMETPVNVQVVPKQVLQDQQAIVIDEATKNVSDVFTTPYVGLQGGWLIRGFVDYAYYLDGVRVNPWAAIPPRDTVDVQQVEIVKGPSSILYGRMEPGGLVEVTTKMPQAEPHYEAQQLFGSYSAYRTTMSATGPVTQDKSLLYRFDVASQNEDSFTDALHNRHIFLAPKIFWKPDEDTSATIYLQFYRGRDGIFNGIPSIYNPDVSKWMNSVAAVPRSRSYGAPDAALETNSDLRVGYRFSHSFDKDWTIVHRLDINVRDFPEKWTDVYNPDPVSCSLFSCPVSGDVFLFANKEQNFYTSVDLTGHFDTFGLGHTLLVGADGYRTNDDIPYVGNWSLVPPVNLYFPGYPVNLMPFNAIPDTIARFQQTENWYGVYLQDQIKLPYNFFLLGGFRYDSARADTSFPQYYPTPTPDFSTSPADAIKPRAGLLWQPIPQLSLYGNYIEGFGVSNGVDATTHKALPPQEATQWEGGVKLSLLDDRLTGTASWFHIVKTNVPSPVQGGPGQAIGLSQTTGAVRNTGVEFDVQGQITPELKIIGSFATIDTKIISEINGGKAGNHWWGVPRNSGSLWAVYEPQFEAIRGFAFGAGFVSRGSVWVDRNNSFTLPGYTTVDLMSRYSFEYEKRKVTFQVNVSNLSDQKYYLTQGWNGGFIPGVPRIFKGSMKVEF